MAESLTTRRKDSSLAATEGSFRFALSAAEHGSSMVDSSSSCLKLSVLWSWPSHIQVFALQLDGNIAKTVT